MKTIAPAFLSDVTLTYEVLPIPLGRKDQFIVYFSHKDISYFSMALYDYSFAFKNAEKSFNNFLALAFLASILAIFPLGGLNPSEKAILLVILLSFELITVNILKERKKKQMVRETIEASSPLWAGHFIVEDQKIRQPLNPNEIKSVLEEVMQRIRIKEINSAPCHVSVICKVGMLRSRNEDIDSIIRDNTMFEASGIYFDEYFDKFLGIFAFGDWSNVGPVVLTADFQICPLIPVKYLRYPARQHPHYVSLERSFSAFFMKLYADFPYLRKNDGYYHFIGTSKMKKQPVEFSSEGIKAVFIPQCVIATSGHRGAILRILKGE